MLCKKISRDVAVFPHHTKFSELLQSATNKYNPMLSNKFENGYEIEIYCECYVCHLILSITSVFELLDLDIRTINIQINEENNKFNSTFFLQEKNNNKNRRSIIEEEIAKIFESSNIAASIKTKEIEIGQKALDLDNSLHSLQIATLASPSISVSASAGLQNLAAITQSTVIITPNSLKAPLPPSIEKGETIFNLIGLLDNGDVDRIEEIMTNQT
eukprot:UN03268